MSARLSVTVAGAIVATVLTGCTAAESGQASPEPVDQSQAAKESANTPALPQRTKELSLQGADPCELLTEQQLNELKVNGIPSAVGAGEQVDGPACSFRVDLAEPYYSYLVTTVTTADIQDWLTGAHKKSSWTKEPVDIPGFPAVTTYLPGKTARACQTLVGVAMGQTLEVQLMPLSTGAFTQEKQCEMSTNVAKLAVQTLESRQ